MKNISVLLAIACIISAYLLPLTTPPNANFQKEWLVFLSLFFLLFGTQQLQWKIDEISASLVLWLAVIAAQYALGLYTYSSDALLPSFYIIAFLTAYLTASQLENKQQGFELLLAALLFAACVSALIAIYRWQYPHIGHLFIEPQRGFRAQANLGQTNHLASLVNWGIIASLYFFHQKKLSLIPTLVFISLLCLTLALTNSRTGFIELVLISAAFIIYNVGSKKKQLIMFIASITTATLFLYLPDITNFIQLSHINIDAGLETANPETFSRGNTRLENWTNISHAIFQGGALGWGWLQTSTAILTTLNPQSMPGEIFTYSHNIVLDLAVWNGPYVTLIILVLLGLWIYRNIYLKPSPHTFFTLLMFLSLGVHCLLEYPYAYAYFSIPVFFMAGLISSNQRNNKTDIKPILLFGILSSAAVLLFSLLKEGLILEKESQLTRFQMQRYISSLNAPALSNDIIFLDVYRERYRLTRLDTQDLSHESLQELKDIAYRFPSGNLPFRYAVALGLNGEEEKALIEMNKIKLFTDKNLYILLQGIYQKMMLGEMSMPHIDSTLLKQAASKTELQKQ